MEYYLAIKKNKIMSFAATWIEIETLILSEVKSERESKIPYDITFICNLIFRVNEPFHRKETHGLGEQTCGCHRGGEWSGMDWESGVSIC